jgi:hypothetical protein
MASATSGIESVEQAIMTIEVITVRAPSGVGGVGSRSC